MPCFRTLHQQGLCLRRRCLGLLLSDARVVKYLASDSDLSRKPLYMKVVMVECGAGQGVQRR
ncbi:hypothetical protein SJ05684_a40650 (plasmid) [Sinorhizobium sojae CCBAU 05684]|uniref:Uncharacterized protein n=1 Tax=Sinorhizobium sojae CCBAU 05684 TaxID=716928 RepID=A0A249PN71_9HYPH|nr:hypothetical protein SS05631_a45410 [Sinorhizobium sp. CCBAU 05631]ASY67378.1 hypothetical protein SJ05684_a40650 [Sinorhizobium sojae CCBAU 05684]